MLYLEAIPAYVYKIVCRPTSEFYYGFRYAHIHNNRYPQDDLWVTYFTSSEIINNRISTYGKENFSYEIIYTNTDIDETYWHEQELIKDSFHLDGSLNRHYRERHNGAKVFKAGAGTQGMSWWHRGEGEQTMSINRPVGNGWMKGQHPNVDNWAKGISWWYRGEEEQVRSREMPPGEGWCRGYHPSVRVGNSGYVWWNNGHEEILHKSNPGSTWVPGRWPRNRQPPNRKGQKWWNNGLINITSEESPGPEWSNGMITGSNPTALAPWWNNGIRNKRQQQCPGPEWRSGMLSRKNRE